MLYALNSRKPYQAGFSKTCGAPGKAEGPGECQCLPDASWGRVCLDVAWRESTSRLFSSPAVQLCCVNRILFHVDLKRTVQLAVTVFIVRSGVCARSHRGTNCEREMLGWLLCRGGLRRFAFWKERSSESGGENCG